MHNKSLFSVVQHKQTKVCTYNLGSNVIIALKIHDLVVSCLSFSCAIIVLILSLSTAATGFTYREICLAASKMDVFSHAGLLVEVSERCVCLCRIANADI